MNITPINNINFGKKPVLDCVLKDKQDKKCYATLYKMDRRNPKDRDEICDYKELENMQDTFLGLSNNADGMNFYVLKDNETDDVIAAAQTSRHFAPCYSKYCGNYTSINEITKSGKYYNSVAPLLGQIAKDAYTSYDQNILTGINVRDTDYLKKFKFNKTEGDSWVLPRRRFGEVIDLTTNRNQTHFYG